MRFLLLALSIAVGAAPQATAEFEQVAGGPVFDRGVFVNTTKDGGYIASGVTKSFGEGGEDIYLVRTDAGGEILWTKTYGGANDDCGWTVHEIPGGFVLAGFTNSVRYVDIAHQALAQMQPMMSQYPLGFGQWLQALTYALSKPLEIAILGDPDAADTQALLNVVRGAYQPFQVVALGAPDEPPAVVPLLRDRGLVEGHAAAYVCRNLTCRAPVTKSDRLRAQLEQG